MQGYNFPWSDFHELNFDWLMKKFKFLSSKIEKIPTKVSQLVNDLGFINALQASAAAPVQSVNGQAGDVVLDATDVGALPDTYTAPVTSVNTQTGDVVLDAADVGALPDTYVPPVASVNSQTGAVVLDAADVGALPDTYVPPVTSVNSQTGAVVLNAAAVGAIPAGTGIVTESKTGSAQTISANGIDTWTIDISKSGYTPIGIVGVSKTGTGASYILPYQYTFSGNSADVKMRNLHTSNAYTITPEIIVLYIKN